MLTLCVSLILNSPFSILNAQEYVHVNFPDHLCAGTIDTLTFGFNSSNDISLVLRHATLGQSERIFLPDGEPCDGSCSYRSPVTFTDFAPTAHITSAQDIKYVRLNIEHSYVGDIFIGITCPNQQKAILMPWKGTGSSNCKNQVPTNARQWSSGSNMSSTTFFGQAYDYTAYDDCDSTLPGNAPGIGWNYCWSNNTNSGYTYAAGDGLIYRSSNAHNGRIDSSNVAAGTHFYHPQQNFSSLIGCPMNGQWYIEVIDAYGGDNGYIFGWELALDPNLLPTECELIERDIIGNGMTSLNDSTYVLTIPDDLTTDSVMAFTLRMINNCGDTIDSIMYVNVHPNLPGERNDTVCDSYTWYNHTIDHDTVLYKLLHTVHNCDSMLAINLTVNHSTADTIHVDVVENSLPYSILGALFNNAVTDTTLHTTNAVGCDSTVLFSLSVWENVTTFVDSTVCAHMLPIIWNDSTFFGRDTISTTLTTTEGADSVVVMTLNVLNDDTVFIYDTVVENTLPYWCAGRNFLEPIEDEVTHLTNIDGCDSAVHLYLYVWYNVRTDLDTAVCTRKLPVIWGGASFTDTHSVVLHDIHGADSVVTMHVSIITNDTTDIFDTVVENSLPYTFDGQWTFTNNADTNIGLVSSDDCDSILHYRLKVWRNVEESYTRQICTSQLPYQWNGETFDDAGTIVQHLFTSHGADSTVTLELILYPDYDTTIYPAICDNETYTLGPLTLSTPGSYSHHFNTINDCDSLVHADLTVWPTYHIQLYDTVCASAGLTYNGVHYSEAGSYTRNYLTVEQCDSLVTLNLTLKGLYLKAKAHIAPSIVIPGKLDIELTDNSRASIDRLWLIGDEFQSTEPKLTYTYPEEHDSVKLYLIAYSADGCADTLRSLLQIDRSLIFAPNAFTPTQETNSRWYLYSQDLTQLEVWIYNRNGNLVYHYEGMDGSWDGTFEDGGNCPQGAYVFKAEYRTRVYPNRLQTLAGSILLIR